MKRHWGLFWYLKAEPCSDGCICTVLISSFNWSDSWTPWYIIRRIFDVCFCHIRKSRADLMHFPSHILISYPRFLWMLTKVIYILIRSNKMQQYAGIYLLQNYSSCFGCPSHPSSGVHQTVTAASGTGHSIRTTTFCQRGL